MQDTLKILSKRIAELERQIVAYENQVAALDRIHERGIRIINEKDAEIAGIRGDIECLKDRLENGIKYIEADNRYVLVWTKEELEKARKEAARLSEYFAPEKLER